MAQGLQVIASKLVSTGRRLMGHERAPEPDYVGSCDGVEKGELRGWVWRPSAPTDHVEVEQWVDGVIVAKAVANLPRADLSDLGIGAHAWRMPLVLDADKDGPQHVEVRVGDGEALPGSFALAYDRALFSQALGRCDGVENGDVVGWAWRPRYPEEHVEVELWVNGVRSATAVADTPRPDLKGANVGHGRYGWRIAAPLDHAATEPQQIEIRFTDGSVLENGRFELSAQAAAPVADALQPSPPINVEDQAVGCFDGLKGSALHGWARNLASPDEPVEVELWVDGALVSEALANGFRPDLRSGGIGHGRYGWRLPIVLDPGRTEPMQVQIKVKGGVGTIEKGVFELANDLSPDAPVNQHLRSFIDGVLTGERSAPVAPKSVGAEQTTLFLLYCPAQRDAGALWSREYDDYRAAAAAFAPVCRQLGEVVHLDSITQADAVAAANADRDVDCVLLSFAPPRLAPVAARYPVIPVFSWAFPNLPHGAWDGDPRSDWRHALRRAGRAIVFSDFAAAAVRASVGAAFPVTAIPAPVFDRVAVTTAPSLGAREITLDGVVLDSRDYVFDPNDPTVPSPVWPGGFDKRTLTVDGVVFASTLDVNDGRFNWKDLISAFVIANADNADATLIVKLNEAAPEWWRQIYRWLAVLPKFSCRVLAVRGDMDDADERAFLAASHWYVSAAKAEGLCLWLQKFLSAGRPAIAPSHTALADHVDASNALIVASDEEPWTWPDKSESEGWSWTQHPDDLGPTVRRRVSWASLRASIAEGYAIVKGDAARYDRLSLDAARAMQERCSAAAAAERLDAFLGLNAGHAAPTRPPSALLSESTPQ